MREIISLIVLNVTQGLRQRIFWLAAIVCICLLGFSLFLSQMSIEGEQEALRNIVICSIEISTLLLLTFGLVYTFYREKETRLKEVYLSYFSRSSYIAGKLLGYICLCLIYLIFVSFMAAVVLVLRHAFLWQFFTGIYALFLKLSIYCAICLVCASLFDYPVLAIIVTAMLYVASEVAYSASKVVLIFSKGGFLTAASRYIYYLLPNVDKIDLKYQAIYGESVSLDKFMVITAYSVVYIMFCFIVSSAIFSRKEH
jgi:Cu-processing system permease protein